MFEHFVQPLMVPATLGVPTPGASCFIVRNGEGTLFVITAAHVPLGKHAYANWSNWPSTIAVVKPNREATSISLFFELPGGLRHPAFRYMLLDGSEPQTEDSQLADVIALRLPENALDVLGVPATSVISLPQERTDIHRIGQLVTGFGFPNSLPNWPQHPPSSISGRLLGEGRGLYTAALESVPGYSGGPVFTATGDLVGMIMGRNGVAKIASDRIISNVVNSLTLAR